MKRVRAIVSGRVQGVWYRAYTAEKARQLGVSGYVRNLADGTVEIAAVGDAGAVDAPLGWAHEGSPMAQVADVASEPLASEESFEGFEVRH